MWTLLWVNDFCLQLFTILANIVLQFSAGGFQFCFSNQGTSIEVFTSFESPVEDGKNVLKGMGNTWRLKWSSQKILSQKHSLNHLIYIL